MKRVALIGENSVKYVNILLDIWEGGDCVVLIDWRIPFQKCVEILQAANVKQCYMEEHLLSKSDISPELGIKFLEYSKESNLPLELPNETYEKYNEYYDKREALIFYSSGTTGEAKGVILSHYAINMNADAIISYMNLNHSDCFYVVKAFAHSSTLIGELLVALKKKIRLVIAPSIVTPQHVCADTNKFGVTIICLNPTLLEIYSRALEDQMCKFKTLRTIYVSGAILHEKVYNLAKECFKGIDIFNMYGLTEAGPRVAGQKKMNGYDNCVGRALENVEIAIVDVEGNVVKQGIRGVIYINTPSRFMGYVINKQKIKSLYEGWLCTGDRGYFDSDGCLHVVGRIDDMMIVNAHNVFPEDVEQVIKSHEDIRDCVVFDVDEQKKLNRIVCLYETYSGKQIDRSLRKLCLNNLALYEIPGKFIHVEQITVDEYSNLLLKECNIHLTSGTVGRPVEIYWHYNDEMQSNISLWRLRNRYHNIMPSDKYCTLHTTNYSWNKISDYKKIVYSKDKKMLSLNKLFYTENDFVKYYEEMITFQPKWLFFQPSFFIKFTEFMINKNLQIPNSIQYVEFTGEQLTQKAICLVNELYQCDYSNMYGTTETNGIAYMCPHGKMHILEENVYVEVDGEKGISNDTGKAIVTSLTNKVYPLIRYEIGDIIQLCKIGKCDCGKSGIIISQIMGREQKSIVLKNEKVINESIVISILDRVNSKVGNRIKEYKVQAFKEQSTANFIIYISYLDRLWENKIKEVLVEIVSLYFNGIFDIRVNFVYEQIAIVKSGKYSVLEVVE